MEGLPLILARCIMLSLLLKPTDNAQDEVVPCAAPAAPEAGEEVSPASLMKQCRTRSASEWREAGLSPISYVYHQLMHGHGCRHASTVHQLGARPIARPSAEDLSAGFDDRVDFEVADGTLDYFEHCPMGGGEPASLSLKRQCVIPGSSARRRCHPLRSGGPFGSYRGSPATPSLRRTESDLMFPWSLDEEDAARPSLEARGALASPRPLVASL